MTETDVTKITKSDGRYEIETAHNGQKSVIIAESIIIAGGKHCFDFLKDLMSNITIKNSFNKTEVGIRIECDNESFDYYFDSQQDVKLISKFDSERDVRTFCCCRDGVVLQSESYGLNGYNGSSGEQPATGKTNIGILIQTKGKEATKLRNEIRKIGHVNGDSTSLSDFMQSKHVLLGKTVDDDIRSFINDCFPKMAKADGVVYFPAIEKMGHYPVLKKQLQIEDL